MRITVAIYVRRPWIASAVQAPEDPGPEAHPAQSAIDKRAEGSPDRRIDSSMDPASKEQVRLDVLRDMLQSFSTVYLTLISIIQGAVFGYGVLLVHDQRANFNISQWLLVLVTALFFIVVWHEYVYMSVLFSWVPGVKDAVFPFALGAVELVFVSSIPAGVESWLRASVATISVSALILVNTNWRVYRDQDFNVALRAVLADFPWWHGPKGALAVALFQLLCAIILAVIAPTVGESESGRNTLAALSVVVAATYYPRLILYVRDLRQLRSNPHEAAVLT